MEWSLRIPRVPYNTDSHYYWALISFSILSIILHFVPSNKQIHNALYSANVLSLIGFTFIISIVPDGLYNRYFETIKRVVHFIGLSRVFDILFTYTSRAHIPNAYVFNIISWCAHMVPVIVYRNTYTLGNPLLWIITYLILFGPYFTKIYPLPIEIITPMVLVALTGLYGWIYMNTGRIPPVYILS